MRKFTFNKLSLVILLVVVSSKLFSQAYQPFPEQQGSWVVQQSSTGIDGGYPWFVYEKFETNSDTTIGSYTYRKVMRASSPVKGTPSPPSYGPSVFRFAYRNDSLNKKVFIYTEVAGVYMDTLWYDFNLAIGDTLKESYAIDIIQMGHMDTNRVVVSSIDSVLICGKYHKKFWFNCPLGEGNLIEGVGFEDHFIRASSTWCIFEAPYLYETQFSCTLASIEESNALINQIELFPNPVINTLQINHSKQKMISPLEYSVVDCLGRKAANGIAADEKGIDVSELKNGLYLLKLRDKEGKLFQSKFLKQ
jgi:hypothetical protein